MTIHVTQDHIDQGCPRQCLSCPIALALMEATGQQWKVEFTNHQHVAAHAILLSKNLTVLLPDVCARFIFNFDRMGGGEPFSFELDWRAA